MNYLSNSNFDMGRYEDTTRQSSLLPAHWQVIYTQETRVDVVTKTGMPEYPYLFDGSDCVFMASSPKSVYAKLIQSVELEPGIYTLEVKFKVLSGESVYLSIELGQNGKHQVFYPEYNQEWRTKTIDLFVKEKSVVKAEVCSVGNHAQIVIGSIKLEGK